MSQQRGLAVPGLCEEVRFAQAWEERAPGSAYADTGVGSEDDAPREVRAGR